MPRRHLALLLLWSALAACASAPPPVPPAAALADCPEPAVAAQVVDLQDVFAVWQLLSLHEVAMGEDSLRQSGADPAGALIFLYEREDLKVVTRQRALEAMAFVPDERVHALYLSVLRDPSNGLRHQVINGFARAWPGEATEVLGKVLVTDVDVQVRLSAASALGHFCGDPGRKLVLQAADTELEPWAREKMLRYARPNASPPGLMPGVMPAPLSH